MNRRSSIISLFGLSLFGVSSFSFYKWNRLNQKVDIASIVAYRSLIAELAETIIPMTDTPGAKAAGVDGYILNVMVNCCLNREQNKFLYGLKDLEEYTSNNYNKSFLECNISEKKEILNYFKNRDIYTISILNKINDRFLGQSFFSKLKSLTIEGYCMSQLGATQGFAYDYVPVNYEACTIMKPNQKSWATK